MDHIGSVQEGKGAVGWLVERGLERADKCGRMRLGQEKVCGPEEWLKVVELQSSLHQSCNTGSSGPAGPEPEPHGINSLFAHLLFSGFRLLCSVLLIYQPHCDRMAERVKGRQTD